MQTNQQLDARGLSCPLPILKAKKALEKLATGDVLEVLTTDKGSVRDMVSLCEQTGNQLLTTEQKNDNFLFLIKKG